MRTNRPKVLKGTDLPFERFGLLPKLDPSVRSTRNGLSVVVEKRPD